MVHESSIFIRVMNTPDHIHHLIESYFPVSIFWRSHLHHFVTKIQSQLLYGPMNVTLSRPPDNYSHLHSWMSNGQTESTLIDIAPLSIKCLPTNEFVCTSPSSTNHYNHKCSTSRHRGLLPNCFSSTLFRCDPQMNLTHVLTITHPLILKENKFWR